MRYNGKKIFACLLTVLLLCMGLEGCSSQAQGTAVSAGNSKILFIITDTNDTFRALLADGIKKAAASMGVSLDIVETGDDVETQAECVNSARSKGYTAIILRLADSSTALQMNVASNGLPIIYVNNEPDASHLTADSYVFVGSNEEEAGQFQAEYVLKRLGNPASLDVIIFEGEAGHSGTIGRTKSVKSTLKKNGCNANYVFVDYANWTDTQAKDKLSIFMKTGQNVQAIFCNNDTMALGAIEGMKEYGLDYTKIPVCGVDATADGCASIIAGEMAFTVLQDAQGQGEAAVNAAITLGNGGSISSIDGATENNKYIYVPFVPVDSSNVNQYK